MKFLLSVSLGFPRVLFAAGNCCVCWSIDEGWGERKHLELMNADSANASAPCSISISVDRAIPGAIFNAQITRAASGTMTGNTFDPAPTASCSSTCPLQTHVGPSWHPSPQFRHLLVSWLRSGLSTKVSSVSPSGLLWWTIESL